MALTGLETLQVLGQTPSNTPAATTQTTTTAAIAALAATESSFTATNITTVGNGTLTAAGLVGGEIVRSGPVAAFSDTTDTAANIVAALPGGVAAGTFNMLIKNTTAFTQTILAGTGITLPSTVITPPFSVNNYVGQVVSGTAITFLHIDTTPISIGQNVTAPALTALSTVGAGTILATSFASSLTARSGAQSGTPFTDTTDIAASIIAACANLVNKIGTSFVYRYVNNTNAVATITGGTGVTVSGIAAVPANAWAEFLVTYTAAATLTMVGVGQGFFPHSGTFANNGTSTVTTSDTNVTAGSQVMITLKTVGGTVGAIPHLLTVTPGTGFATVGTASDTSTYTYTILG